MICQKCNSEFPKSIVIDDKRRNLQRRKFCLTCSPFGEHNVIDLNKRPEQAKCLNCSGSLKRNQLKYCSSNCRSKHLSQSNNSTYRCQQGRSLQRKIELINLLGGKCETCGYNKNLSALVFHHRDASQKRFSLDARHLSNSNLERIHNEVKKCSLLCCNCHAELHYPYLNLDCVVQAACSNH